MTANYYFHGEDAMGKAQRFALSTGFAFRIHQQPGRVAVTVTR